MHPDGYIIKTRGSTVAGTELNVLNGVNNVKEMSSRLKWAGTRRCVKEISVPGFSSKEETFELEQVEGLWSPFFTRHAHLTNVCVCTEHSAIWRKAARHSTPSDKEVQQAIHHALWRADGARRVCVCGAVLEATAENKTFWKAAKCKFWVFLCRRFSFSRREVQSSPSTAIIKGESNTRTCR